MDNKIFTENWEQKLETLLLTTDSREHFSAYICSPLNAETGLEILHNMRSARTYMYYACMNMNFIAKAPHAYLPALLNDNIAEERDLAIKLGNKLLKDSHYILVCGNRLSEGMKSEIMQAFKSGINIVAFSRDMEKSICEYLKNNDTVKKRKKKSSVIFDSRNQFMSQPDPLAYIEGGGE
jgi:hypothetical protein